MRTPPSPGKGQPVAGEGRVMLHAFQDRRGLDSLRTGWWVRSHPGASPGANLKSISHRCYLFEVAFVWELTK